MVDPISRARERVGFARLHRGLSQQAAVISGAGAFDLEWYQAQRGVEFASEQAAVKDYLLRPREGYLSPHPFFEPAYFDKDFLDRDVDPLVWFLTSPRKLARAPHPLVERRVQQVVAAQSCDTTEAWLRVVADKAAWSADRARLLSAARRWRAAEDLAAPDDHVGLVPVPRSVGQSTPDAAALGPRVSVVMRNRNAAPMLRQVVASVQAQTLRDWELVVVDDGSTDDSLRVLEGIRTFDDRVRVVPQENIGECRALNVALDHARGEYVAFLGTEVAWGPDFLAATLAAMAANGWGVAHAALQVDAEDPDSLRTFEGTYQELLEVDGVDLRVVVAVRELVERIGGFDETLRRGGDHDLVLRLSARFGLHLVRVLGGVVSERGTEQARAGTVEPHTWEAVVLDRHLVDWDRESGRERTAGRVSVLLPVRDDVASTLAWVARVSQAVAQGYDVELVVVASGSSRAVYLLAEAALASLPLAVVHRTAVDVGIPVATNLALARSTGELLVLARPHLLPDGSWLPPLVEALSRPRTCLAQPVLLRTNGTVESAGGSFAGNDVVPMPFLRGFPLSDAVRVGLTPLPAVYGGLFALRAADAVTLHGLDPLLGNSLSEVDLSLRAAEAGLGSSVLVPDSHATSRPRAQGVFPPDFQVAARVISERWLSPPSGSDELWASAGFSVAGVRPAPTTEPHGEPSYVVRPELHRLPRPDWIEEGVPRLRWTIDTAAPAGALGERWGDTHFARSLAAALELRGQDVAVDFREARNRPTRMHDDVLLVVRGLDQVLPRRGLISIQWIISHPELVDVEEAKLFDAVFAASTKFAARATKEWKLPVKPLLQCTNPELFNPDRAAPDSGHPILFVGNSRHVDRPAVRFAVDGGFDVAIYGKDWRKLVRPDLLKGEAVPNAELGALYAAAGVVLNDHWADMRREGFLSNRLFDAVACGARVITDDIPGLREVFGESVQIFHSPEQMRLLAEDPRSTFPDLEARREAARRVAEDHSFDRRAEQLVDEAVRLWKEAKDNTGLARRPGRST